MDEEIESRSNRIELSFPTIPSQEEEGYLQKGIKPEKGLLERFSATLEDVSDWFNRYQVDTIELWISGVMETGGVTRLVVSAKGEGGLKVVLKPRSKV